MVPASVKCAEEEAALKNRTCEMIMRENVSLFMGLDYENYVVIIAFFEFFGKFFGKFILPIFYQFLRVYFVIFLAEGSVVPEARMA